MAELKSTKIAAALTAAMAERRLVRLTTRYDEGAVRGYVVAMGVGFVMVSVVNDRVWLDGFECFRRPDIDAVKDEPHAAFVEKALALRGEIIPAPPPVSLSSIEELLGTAARAFGLITIHCEELDPGVCYIGRIIEIAGGDLMMRDVTPAAEWEAGLEHRSLGDIARIGFGADYEDALSLVAGACPPA